MTHAHTPGPWVVGAHPGNDAGSAWRTILSAPQEFGRSYVAEALDVDAQLIARAPTLLAALEHTVAVLMEAQADGQFTVAQAESILFRARAALGGGE